VLLADGKTVLKGGIGKLKSKPETEPLEGQGQRRGPVAYDDYPPRVEPGPYEARCIDAPPFYFDRGFKRWVQPLTFELHPNREVLHAFLNMGRGTQPHAGTRSNFFKAWVIAKGRPPRRGNELTTDVFISQLFEVDVQDVTTDCEGREKAEPLIYSRVARVVRRLT
jgi:hypothetical protein